MASSSSVVMPGRDGGRRSRPAPRRRPGRPRRMRSITSGDCTGGSGRRTAVPDSAYGGRGDRRRAPARVGLSRPGRTRSRGRLVAALELLAAPAPAGVVGLEHPVAASTVIGPGYRRYRCHDGGVPSSPLEPLPPRGAWRRSSWSPCRCARHAAARPRRARAASATVLLVHVRADEAEGWAECAVEPQPDLRPGVHRRPRAVLVLRDHLLPAVAWTGPTGDALALGPHLDARARATTMAGPPSSWPCSTRSCGPPVARWRAGWAPRRPPSPAGAALRPARRRRRCSAEADAALAAGAARLRVKVAPGRAAEPLAALRAHVGPDVLLQADANGTFSLDDPHHVAELDRLDESAWPASSSRWRPTTCSATPGWPSGSPRRSASTSRSRRSARIEAAVALGRLRGRLPQAGRGSGGGSTARRSTTAASSWACPCGSAGCSRPAIGRAANLALAALPGMTLPPDLDPRGRFDPDLADPRRPVDGPRRGARPARAPAPSPDAALPRRRRGRASLAP